MLHVNVLQRMNLDVGSGWRWTVVLCAVCCGVKYMHSMSYIELFFCVIFISTVLSCMWCVYYASVFFVVLILCHGSCLLGVLDGGLLQQHC
jgi:hypothetical protein